MSMQLRTEHSPAVARTNEHVLVTGGAGFIGRRLVSHLIDLGANVTVVDQVPFPDDNVRSVVGDLRDKRVVKRAVGGNIDTIFHLAAVTSVLKSNNDPTGTYRMNVGVTQRLLQRAVKRNVPRFVLASTNAVTGNVGSNVINESTPLNPLTLYGGTKAAGEMLVQSYAASFGMQGTILRFANVYGPGMENKDSFVPRLMRAARDGTSVQIYGDGTQKRDLVYVDDVVTGGLLAWQADLNSQVILGSGESISVNNMVDTARLVTGRNIPAEHIASVPGEMPAVIVDITRAQQDLGYIPQYDFRAGLETVWPEFVPAA